jgi:hypothetical protein
LEQQPSSLDDLLYRCTVRVEVGGKQKGTGFFVAPGMVLTCAHVVEDVTGQPTAQPIEMYWHWGGRHHTAQIQNTDFLPKPYPDLALLRAGEELEHPCVYLDRYSDVQLDDKLYSYGYTEEYENGDSAYFDYEGPSHDPDFLKLKNAQASHGMSGAPLLDRRTGAVCGILKRSRNPNSDLGGRAVSASTILSSFPELQELQTKFHERNRSWTSLLSYVTRGKFRLSPDDRKGYKADIISPQEHVLMRPHAEPLPPPPPLAGFLDRTSDVDAVTHVLAGGSPADVHGPTGVGKTAMLHQLANHKFDTPFRDGIVFPTPSRNCLKRPGGA